MEKFVVDSHGNGRSAAINELQWCNRTYSQYGKHYGHQTGGREVDYAWLDIYGERGMECIRSWRL
jgi:hypothetical protein